MKILAFDTSSSALSAAIFDGKKKLGLHESHLNLRHSETLAVTLQKLLKTGKIKPKNIDCVAVGLGPGSFSGLRIGVTTAKILSYALKAKLVGISSLEAMARSAERDGDFAVTVDAKKSQVYAAVYRRKNGRWRALQKPHLAVKDIFLKSLESDVEILDGVSAKAVSIVDAARERVRDKKLDDPFTLTPLYLHPKDCNVHKKSKK